MLIRYESVGANASSGNIQCTKYGRIATVTLTSPINGYFNSGNTIAILPEGFEPVFNVYACNTAISNARYYLQQGKRNLVYYGPELSPGTQQWLTMSYITNNTDTVS